MPRTLKFDIPGRDFRIYFDEYAEPPSLARWAELFADDVPVVRDLVVDIGFGRGEFLIDLAKQSPDRAFVGIERSFKRTLKMARRLPRLGIRNVRLIESDAQGAIPEFFPKDSIASAFINFPDPWPKDRHGPRRLVQGPFISDLVDRVVDGGELNLATDDPAYGLQMVEVLAAEPRLENLYAPEPFRRDSRGLSPTAYEVEWKSVGRTCRYFACRKHVVERGVGAPAQVDVDTNEGPT